MVMLDFLSYATSRFILIESNTSTEQIAIILLENKASLKWQVFFFCIIKLGKEFAKQMKIL